MITEEYVSQYEPVIYGKKHMVFVTRRQIYDEDWSDVKAPSIPGMTGGIESGCSCPYCGSAAVAALHTECRYGMQWITYECGMQVAPYMSLYIGGISYRTDMCRLVSSQLNDEDTI